MARFPERRDTSGAVIREGLWLLMIRGKLVSFDRIKGYGFVAPDSGGEDVFVHVNDLYSDKSLLQPGCVVEFRLDEGDRGPKASEVTVVGAAEVPAVAAAIAPQPSAGEQSGGEELCDVLSASEYERELTEALLRVEPELTSLQILDTRKRLLRIAQTHGWSDR